jgi:D-arabinose 1-dehydrogenase-like Zn-dependent alcohol dehydrogenase
MSLVSSEPTVITASDAAFAMELGCDGVLMNTAIAAAQNPIHMAVATGTYVLTGIGASLSTAFHLIAGTGAYVLTGIPLIVAHLIAPASKFKRRISKFVFEKRRVSGPTLED